MSGGDAVAAGEDVHVACPEVVAGSRGAPTVVMYTRAVVVGVVQELGDVVVKLGVHILKDDPAFESDPLEVRVAVGQFVTDADTGHVRAVRAEARAPADAEIGLNLTVCRTDRIGHRRAAGAGGVIEGTVVGLHEPVDDSGDLVFAVKAGIPQRRHVGDVALNDPVRGRVAGLGFEGLLDEHDVADLT